MTPASGRVFGPLSRRVGAVHLAVAGAVNALTATGLLLVATGDPSLFLVTELVARGGSTFALRHGATAVTVARWVLPAACFALFALALLQFAFARRAYRGTHWQASVYCCCLGLANPAAAPVTAAGLVLLAMSRRQFSQGRDRQPEEVVADAR